MYIHQWNLSIQRQVGDWLLSANYIGNSSIHLGTSENINPVGASRICTLNVVTGGVAVPTNLTMLHDREPESSTGVRFICRIAGQYYAGIGAYLTPAAPALTTALYLSANKRLKHNVTLEHQLHVVALHQRHLRSANRLRGRFHRLSGREGRGNCAGTDLRQSFRFESRRAVTALREYTWLRRLASDWQIRAYRGAPVRPVPHDRSRNGSRSHHRAGPDGEPVVKSGGHLSGQPKRQ